MKNSKKKAELENSKGNTFICITRIPAHFHFLQFFQEGLTISDVIKGLMKSLKLQSIIKSMIVSIKH